MRLAKTPAVPDNCGAEFKRRGFVWRMHDLWQYGHVKHTCMMSSQNHVIPHICPCTCACIAIDTTVKEKK